MASSVAMSSLVLQQVFAATELLALVVSFVDELSLARAIRVSRLIRDVNLNTKSLRARIGLCDKGSPVLDTSRMFEHDYRSNDTLHRNPLLDWFTSRIISSRSSDMPQGPISNSKSLVIFHILPNALQAVEKKNSLVHKVWITTPPVTAVRIHFTLKNAERWPTDWMSTGVEVSHATGVTIGHLLELWVDREPYLERHMSLALGIYIPPSFRTDIEEDEVEAHVGNAMNKKWEVITQAR